MGERLVVEVPAGLAHRTRTPTPADLLTDPRVRALVEAVSAWKRVRGGAPFAVTEALAPFKATSTFCLTCEGRGSAAGSAAARQPPRRLERLEAELERNLAPPE